MQSQIILITDFANTIVKAIEIEFIKINTCQSNRTVVKVTTTTTVKIKPERPTTMTVMTIVKVTLTTAACVISSDDDQSNDKSTCNFSLNTCQLTVLIAAK